MKPFTLKRTETILFWIVTLLNLVPFVFTKFFPSLDGASHLANANIIQQLVVHQNDFFQTFFRINPEPVPNWTAHLLLSVLGLVLPAWLAEKILIVILVAGLPLVFRRLMNTLTPGHTLASFLIFPFTHSMFLFFGFFNFSLGILFYMITLNYWINHSKTPFSARNVLVLTLLISLTYFSHIVVFGLLGLTIFLHIKVYAVRDLVSRTVPFSRAVRRALLQSGALGLASLIPLFLFIYFFFTRPGSREVGFHTRSELLEFLVSIRPLISLNPVVEAKDTTLFFYLLSLLVIAGFLFLAVRTIRKYKSRKHDQEGNPSFLPGVWLILTLLCFGSLYFLLPNSYGTASYTNLRIAWFIFVLSLLLIASFRLPKPVLVPAVVAGLYLNASLLMFYLPSIRDMSRIAQQCNGAAAHLPPNSLVLPLNYLDNWFTGHFVDYPAIDNSAVMAYNYECESGYFPVVWNQPARPNYHLGSPGEPENNIPFEIVKGRPSLPLTHVFILGRLDPAKDWFSQKLYSILSTRADTVYMTEYCLMYRIDTLSGKR